MNFFRVPHPECFILTVLHYVVQSPNSCFQQLLYFLGFVLHFTVSFS